MTGSVLIDGESLGYGPTVVLSDVTLRLDPGERVVLLGRSGAGKSTLLAALYRRLVERGRRVALEWHGAALRLDDEVPDTPTEPVLVTLAMEEEPLRLLVPPPERRTA